jgi:hypothetical protein
VCNKHQAITASSSKAACTRCKLARVSQVAGIRAQTFHASYGKFDRLRFEANCDLREMSAGASSRLDSREPSCIVYARLK